MGANDRMNFEPKKRQDVLTFLVPRTSVRRLRFESRKCASIARCSTSMSSGRTTAAALSGSPSGGEASRVPLIEASSDLQLQLRCTNSCMSRVATARRVSALVAPTARPTVCPPPSFANDRRELTAEVRYGGQMVGPSSYEPARPSWVQEPDRKSSIFVSHSSRSRPVSALPASRTRQSAVPARGIEVGPQ